MKKFICPHFSINGEVKTKHKYKIKLPHKNLNQLNNQKQICKRKKKTNDKKKKRKKKISKSQLGKGTKLAAAQKERENRNYNRVAMHIPQIRSNGSHQTYETNRTAKTRTAFTKPTQEFFILLLLYPSLSRPPLSLSLSLSLTDSAFLSFSL